MTINEWAEDLQREVFNKSKTELPENNSDFKIFNSPVQKRPPLLIVGNNPGSSKDDSLPRSHMQRFSKGDFSLPTEHEILTKEWKLTEALQDGLFRNNVDAIHQTVMTNRTFLHTSTDKDLDRPVFKEFNDFCEKKCIEIVERLEPELVLCLSQDTYNFFKKEYDFSTIKERPREKQSGRSKRLLWVADKDAPKFMWIVHPSSSQVPSPSRADWETIREEVPLHASLDI